MDGVMQPGRAAIEVRSDNGPRGYANRRPLTSVIAPYLIAALVALAACSIAVQTRLWDRDEARYARATVEMIESGDYLVPTFNGEPRLHKPPLIYWLMSIAVRIVGPTEFAFRCFSCISVAGTCLMTYFIGRRLLSERAGLWAMAMLGFSLMMIYIGTAASTDSVLLFLTTAQMALMLRMLMEGVRLMDVLWLGLAIGASLLEKGPAGIWPAAVVSGIIGFGRAHRPKARALLAMCAALGIGSVMFLAWAIPANGATGGGVWQEGIGFHVVERAFRPLEGHGGGIWAFLFFYPVVILIGFMPWSGLIPIAIRSAATGETGGDFFRRVFFCWVAIPLALMTVVQTKLPHYIAPVLPSLALSTGGLIADWTARRPDERSIRWFRRTMWAGLATSLVLGAAMIVLPGYLGVPGLWAPSAASGLVLIVGAVAVFRIRERGIDRVVLAAMGVTALCMLPAIFGAAPALDAVKSGPAIGLEIRALSLGKVPVASVGAQEPTVYFYAGQRVEEVESPEAVLSWLRRHSEGLLVMSLERKNLLEKEIGPLPVEVVGSRRGFNYSKGILEEIIIVRAR